MPMFTFEDYGCFATVLRCEYNPSEGKYVCDVNGRYVHTENLDITVRPKNYLSVKTEGKIIGIDPLENLLCCRLMKNQRGEGLFLKCTSKGYRALHPWKEKKGIEVARHGLEAYPTMY